MNPIKNYCARANVLALQAEPNFRRFIADEKTGMLVKVNGWSRFVRLILNILTFGKKDREVCRLYNLSIKSDKTGLKTLKIYEFTVKNVKLALQNKDINALFNKLIKPIAEVPEASEVPEEPKPDVEVKDIPSSKSEDDEVLEPQDLEEKMAEIKSSKDYFNNFENLMNTFMSYTDRYTPQQIAAKVKEVMTNKGLNFPANLGQVLQSRLIKQQKTIKEKEQKQIQQIAKAELEVEAEARKAAAEEAAAAATATGKQAAIDAAAEAARLRQINDPFNIGSLKAATSLVKHIQQNCSQESFLIRVALLAFMGNAYLENPIDLDQAADLRKKMAKAIHLGAEPRAHKIICDARPLTEEEAENQMLSKIYEVAGSPKDFSKKIKDAIKAGLIMKTSMSSFFKAIESSFEHDGAMQKYADIVVLLEENFKQAIALLPILLARQKLNLGEEAFLAFRTIEAAKFKGDKDQLIDSLIIEIKNTNKA